MGRKQKSNEEKIKAVYVGLLPKHLIFVKKEAIDLSVFIRLRIDELMKKDEQEKQETTTS